MIEPWSCRCSGECNCAEVRQKAEAREEREEEFVEMCERYLSIEIERVMDGYNWTGGIRISLLCNVKEISTSAAYVV